MAWVSRKKRTRWLLRGKAVPARTPGAKKQTTSSEFYYAFWYEGKKLRQKELRGCTDKRVARSLLNEILLSGSTEKPPPPPEEPPLKDYLEDYLASMKGARGEKTRRQAATYLGLLLAEVGLKRLADLAFNEGLDAAAGPNAGYKMQKNVCSMVNSFLRFVCRKTNRRSPPAGFYQAPKDESYVAARHGTLSAGEAKKLLAKMAEPSTSPFARVRRARKKRHLIYWLMLSTLTRFKTVSELKACQFTLAPLAEACVHLQAGQTKSRRAASKPLSGPLALALAAFIEECGLSPEDRPLSISFTHFYRSWLEDLAEAGLRTSDPAGRILAPHSLKATGITLLIDQGLDVATVAELAEHTDVRLTLTVYNDQVLRRRPLLRQHIHRLQEALGPDEQQGNSGGQGEAPGRPGE